MTYYQGQMIDPEHIIEKFIEMVSMLPKVGSGKIKLKTAREYLKGYDQDLINQYMNQPKHKTGVTLTQSRNADDRKDVVADFEKWLKEKQSEKVKKSKPISPGSPPSESEKDEPGAERKSGEWAAEQAHERKMAEIEEKHEEEEAKAPLMEKMLEVSIAENNAKILQKILTEKFNIKLSDKLPKALLKATKIATSPADIDHIIELHKSKLLELKASNDTSDALGKKKRAITVDKITKEYSKLSDAKITMKKKLKEAAKEAMPEAVVPAAIIEELADKPRGKVVLVGPGRGRGKRAPKVIATILEPAPQLAKSD